MAQDNFNPSAQALLLDVVKTFTEHPNSLRILLDNPTLNNALSNYIDAAAERMRPASEWVKVWEERGTEVRIYKLDSMRYWYDNHGLPTGRVKVVSFVRASYHERMKVVVCDIGLTDAQEHFMMDAGRELIQILATDSAIVGELKDAIEWAQGLKRRGQDLFFAATTLISSEENHD